MTLLIQYTLIFASVLMLVALGGCFAERSGVINIGLEGIMVIGALGGALVLKFMPVSVGAPVMVITTVIVSALFGMVFSLLLAVAAINFKADQTITGTAMNMLATAAATVAVKAMNTAASGGNDVSSDISYTRTKDLLLVHVGGFELNWFMLVAVLCLIAAYVAGGSGEELPFKPSRRLHLDSARLRSLTREERRSLESDRRAAASLRHCAVDALSSAKRLHDELEAVYRPYVNFPALDMLAQAEIASLGL